MPRTDAPSPLLEVQSLVRGFGGVRALDGVSLIVEAGEAVGLIGPNGAGKTTLLNCISGLDRADAGTVRLRGRSLDGVPAYRRARMGMARTFQRVQLFAGMTVRDHLIVAQRARDVRLHAWRDVLNLSAPSGAERARAERVMATTGVSDEADRPVETLSLGWCRRVELACALVVEPALLLADEPSSGLDDDETHEMVGLLREVAVERPMAVLLVEHDLAMVRDATDRVVVLDAGSLIAQGPFDAVMADQGVRRAYLGQTA
jgi:branched-chain amino acid transport system ATP-binding protein